LSCRVTRWPPGEVATRLADAKARGLCPACGEEPYPIVEIVVREIPVLDYVNGVFVFRCAYDDALIPRRAGFVRHEPQLFPHGNVCKACAAGLGRCWFTFDKKVAMTLFGYSSPALIQMSTTVPQDSEVVDVPGGLSQFPMFSETWRRSRLEHDRKVLSKKTVQREVLPTAIMNCATGIPYPDDCNEVCLK
jgi:hypothetical protein